MEREGNGQHDGRDGPRQGGGGLGLAPSGKTLSASFGMLSA